ncbi:MAG: hypothetical protein JNL70_10960 [Saprospiraceae bacterium]|nr:hypothetical protein [Saprospiraceae bacterium]
MKIKNLLIVVFSICFMIWLNTHNVSYDFIREWGWKNYSGHSQIFGDVVDFKNNRNKLGDIIKNDGNIYLNDSIYLGRVIKKWHNYVNSYIIILDSKNDTATYIAKFYALSKMLFY